jgi:hypothetical protein
MVVPGCNLPKNPSLLIEKHDLQALPRRGAVFHSSM